VDSFRFHPLEEIEFIPGQFLEVIFDVENKKNSELNKFLSFSCAPGREYIEVTKRLSNSIFSERLRRLKAGDEVLIKAPLGECVLKETDKEIGFLIGGIGITPVISILEYIIDNDLKTDVCLFYSNRQEEEIAFKKELNLWQNRNSHIKVFYTVTDRQPSDKNCIFGRIDKNLIMERDNNFNKRAVFIFGSPKMVEAMKSLCIEAGTAYSQIRTEKFLGY